MSEKLTVEQIIRELSALLDWLAHTQTSYSQMAGRSHRFVYQRGRSLIDGIREMQEEIKQGKKVMRTAIDAIEIDNAWAARERLVEHLGTIGEQPKDNGAGDEPNSWPDSDDERSKQYPWFHHPQDDRVGGKDQ